MNLKNLFLISLGIFLLSSKIAFAKPYVKVTILNINDFHGQLEEAYADPLRPSQRYIYPGAARIASWFKQFQQDHPNVLFLAGGDNYQGTMLDNYYHGNSVSDFFNALGISYSALGNHEFDFGYVKNDPNSFIYSAKLKGMNFIASNVVIDDKKETPVDFVEPYQIIKKRMNSRDINIVIIGLATLETPITTSGARGLKFTDPALSAEKALQAAKKELSKQRAKPDVVLFLTHTPSFQQFDPSITNPYVPNPKDPVVYTVNKFLEHPDSEINELTNWIASQKDIKNISAVLSAHSHKMVNGHVPTNTIPVVQAGYSGRGISVVNVTCPKNPNRECSLTTDVVDLTRIAGNYPPDPTVKNLVDHYLNDPTFQQMATREITNSCSAIAMYPAVNNFNFKLHYLIANQMRHSQKTTIGVYNLGGLRGNLPAGNIIFKDLYNSMPFDTYNLVRTGVISGKAIRNMVNDDLHLNLHAQIAIAGIAFYNTPLKAGEYYNGPIYITHMGNGYRDSTDGSFDRKDPSILLKDDGRYTITSVDFLLDADPKYPGDGFDFTSVTDKQYVMDDVHQTHLTVRQLYENELVRDKIPGCQEYTPYNWQNAVAPNR